MRIRNRKLYVLSALAKHIGAKLRLVRERNQDCICGGPAFYLVMTATDQCDFTLCYCKIDDIMSDILHYLWFIQNSCVRYKCPHLLIGFCLDSFDELELDLVLTGNFVPSDDYEVDIETRGEIDEHDIKSLLS